MYEPIRDITVDLVRCPKCGLQLDAGVPVCPNDGTRVLQTPEIGDLFQNKYVFVERLAAGGMGVVFKAKQQGLERFVAIKVMSNANASANSVRRFQQEAQALARLHHRSLVQVFELGVTPYGQPYTVMEFVDGKGLDEVLAQRKMLTLNKALHVFAQVCEGLSYVHESGVLHRDLKPSNIMLINPFDDQPTVKLVDFGIAKLMDTNSQRALTQTGEVMGSPNYMSPEQAKGLPCDVRSDIYSLGCVMYEALTGVAPFDGGAIVEIILRQVNNKHKPLNAAVRGIKYPNLLETIVDKMLAKDPNERYDSVEELRSDLAKLEGENRVWYHIPVTALQRGSHDSFTLFAVVAVALVILIGVGFLLFNVFFAGNQAAIQTQARKDNVGPDKELTDGMIEDVLSGGRKTESTRKRSGVNKKDQPPENKQVLAGPDAIQLDDHRLVSPGGYVSAEAFKTRLAQLQYSYFTALSCSDQSGLDDESFKLLKHQPLLELIIPRTKITRASIPALAQMHTLETLNLSNIECKQSDYRLLGGLAQLYSLQLEDCNANDEDVRALLAQVHDLRILELAGCPNLDNNGASVIAQNESKLHFLDLSRTAVGDKGVQALEKLPFLQHLYLSNTRVSDKSFASFEKFPMLKQLDLHGCPIDDEGLSTFKPTGLVSLRVSSHGKVTMRGIRSFSDHNPDCHISQVD